MKNYEQMAADVMQRAEVFRLQQKRNRRIVGGAAAFCCLSVLIAVNIIRFGMATPDDAPFLEQPTVQIGNQGMDDPKVTVGGQPQVKPSIPSTGENAPNEDVQQNYGVVLLMATSPNDPGTELVENLTLPMNYTLRVRNLRGLNDAERELAINEERKINEQIRNEGLGSANWKHTNGLVRDDYMISFVRINQFRLKIENFDMVEKIGIRCETEYGEVDAYFSEKVSPGWWETEILPEDVSDFYRENGLRIEWDYTNALLEALDEDPSMPLSTFSDVVTFTVKFRDGTVQESKVEVAIQDDGQFVVCLMGNTVTA